MKVGDLVRWADFIGIITERVEHRMGGWLWRVWWADGGDTPMWEEELEVVDEGG